MSGRTLIPIQYSDNERLVLVDKLELGNLILDAKIQSETIQRQAKEVETAIEYLHNIREHCLLYTPILEGIDATLRVLKGRPTKQELEKLRG